MNELELINIIVNYDWREVQFIPLYSSLNDNLSNNNLYLDVMFRTEKGNVRLRGNAHSDKEGYDNSFALVVYENQDEGWWSPSSKLDITSLSEQWKGTSFETLMKAPRDVAFKHDPLIHIRQYPSKTFLDHFVSMELSKKTDEGKFVRLIIQASCDDPCCVEVDVSCE